MRFNLTHVVRWMFTSFEIIWWATLKMLSTLSLTLLVKNRTGPTPRYHFRFQNTQKSGGTSWSCGYEWVMKDKTERWRKFLATRPNSWSAWRQAVSLISVRIGDEKLINGLPYSSVVALTLDYEFLPVATRARWAPILGSTARDPAQFSYQCVTLQFWG